MKQLSILISFLVPLANQLAAEEISLICKTREESTTVLSGEKSKTTDDTRVNSSVSLVIGNGVLEDEELLWFPAFDCSGEIRASFGEKEIAVNCFGLVEVNGRKYESGSKSVTVNRYSGDVIAYLALSNFIGDHFFHLYQGSCTKAKKKF